MLLTKQAISVNFVDKIIDQINRYKKGADGCNV
ncbi:hypothetical protein Q783_11270 [Carnobacterium inhibens subsp. gilichinskyi]|uniref:Uncharacterized protein n=1 Tax=Carnobacterium inhibens subsp. gilichinskyi TaxID=1266845 RepID=U5SCV7_9LACT|nr:hypothetical protein Q783_11270 [Carnobacterium inhibens subsp. gilichinskyi]